MPALVLQVFGERMLEVHTLPERGAVSIGRTAENTIAIDEPSISRRHAVLHLGAHIELEDLGSRNGTALRGLRGPEQVELKISAGKRTVVAPGDLIVLGNVVLALRPRSPRAEPPTRPVETVQLGAAGLPPGVVVQAPAMRRVYELAGRLAAGNLSLLLLGETGVGKDVLAGAIHAASPRAKQPLMRLNCAAFSEQLLESELFGHERGAFTGATHAKPGLLTAADGGTVFLDEVGELPASTQAKLLRVLEAGEVMPIGAVKPRPIDVRFVSATNRDLAAEVTRGSFRKDLYFRLNGASLVVPPLRERRMEILPLARAMLSDAARKLARVPPALTPAATRALEAHDWPGNVRELRNVIDRALLLAHGEIGPAELSLTEVAEPAPAEAAAAPAAAPAPARAGGLKNQLQDLERQRIVEALEKSAGNQTLAAQALGMSRRTLVKKLDDYDIPRPRKTRS